ncbi:MAG: hypothetical protein ACTSRZ_09980 [Promethearchaeota archaeon]
MNNMASINKNKNNTQTKKSSSIRKLNILICGIGGQGVVTLGNFLRNYFFHNFNCLNVAGTESRGVSQREGSVISTVRIIYDESSLKNITDLPNSQIVTHSHILSDSFFLTAEIPSYNADIIIAFEPIEFIRNIKYARNDTILIINSFPIVPKNVILKTITSHTAKPIENHPITFTDPNELKNPSILYKKIKDYFYNAFFKNQEDTKTNTYKNFLKNNLFFIDISNPMREQLSTTFQLNFAMLGILIKIIESSNINLHNQGFKNLFNKNSIRNYIETYFIKQKIENSTYGNISELKIRKMNQYKKITEKNIMAFDFGYNLH